MYLLNWIKENAWLFFLIAMVIVTFFDCKTPPTAPVSEPVITLLDGKEVVYDNGKVYPIQKTYRDEFVEYDCDTLFRIEHHFVDTSGYGQFIPAPGAEYREPEGYYIDTLMMYLVDCKRVYRE